MGEMNREYGFSIDDERINRELTLYSGVMWQHTKAMMRIELRELMAEMENAKQAFTTDKQEWREARLKLQEAKARKKQRS